MKTMNPWWKQLAAAALVVWLSGCSMPAIREARELSQSGQQDAAMLRLQSELEGHPDDRELRLAWLQQRDLTAASLAMEAEAAQRAGQWPAAEAVLQRMEKLVPQHPRTAALRADLERQRRVTQLKAEASQALDARQYERAEAALRAILGQTPGDAEARAMLSRVEAVRDQQSRQQATLQLVNGNKPITLEFRDAAVRTVFEALARAADVNFVFDKDVRGDAKVSVFLRKTTLEEALRVVTGTQQLGYKLLNGNTVLVFPATQQKQRDLLDTVTRTFYLVNAEPKQVQSLIRTVAKSRDVFIDERLNLLVVRDTPEVIRLVEQLVQGIDLPDPEVMLELEVLEVSSKDMAQIGINWPEVFNYGVPGGTAPITSDSGLRWYTANPLALLNLKSSRSASNLLANPKIRARNREKAKIMLGEKLPVFTTTSTANVGVSASVSYLDVGLKLEVEPQVQLDNDVTIKVALEVSSITDRVTGPQGSLAYQVGTRQASTTLRLKDGETQILAGLINDNESMSGSGIPGISKLPVAGRLFGTQTDNRDKSEIVLLVTPRIVRNVVQPPVSSGLLPSGTESQPGARPLTLREGGRMGTGVGSGGLLRGGGSAAAPQRGLASEAAAGPRLEGPEEVRPGAGFQVVVTNPTGQPLQATLSVDSAVLSIEQGEARSGNWSVTVPPGGQVSVPVKVRPDVKGTETLVTLDAGGEPLRVRVSDPNARAPEQAGGVDAPPMAADDR